MTSSLLFPEESLFFPTQIEELLLKRGYRHLAGTDEAGRGALAGPVVAAAVILDVEAPIPGIKDSKLLSPSQREFLYSQITTQAKAWAVGLVSVEEIDHVNIFRASLQAMAQAVQGLSLSPDYLLVDGSHRLPLFLPQRAVVKGDRYCRCVGAASIVAKVTRDRLMQEYEQSFPGYGFALHKGYPTAKHRQEIQRLGPSPLHRKSFKLLPDVSS